MAWSVAPGTCPAAHAALLGDLMDINRDMPRRWYTRSSMDGVQGSGSRWASRLDGLAQKLHHLSMDWSRATTRVASLKANRGRLENAR